QEGASSSANFFSQFGRNEEVEDVHDYMGHATKRKLLQGERAATRAVQGELLQDLRNRVGIEVIGHATEVQAIDVSSMLEKLRVKTTLRSGGGASGPLQERQEQQQEQHARVLDEDLHLSSNSEVEDDINDEEEDDDDTESLVGSTTSTSEDRPHVAPGTAYKVSHDYGQNANKQMVYGYELWPWLRDKLDPKKFDSVGVNREDYSVVRKPEWSRDEVDSSPDYNSSEDAEEVDSSSDNSEKVEDANLGAADGCSTSIAVEKVLARARRTSPSSSSAATTKVLEDDENGEVESPGRNNHDTEATSRSRSGVTTSTRATGSGAMSSTGVENYAQPDEGAVAVAEVQDHGPGAARPGVQQAATLVVDEEAAPEQLPEAAPSNAIHDATDKTLLEVSRTQRHAHALQQQHKHHHQPAHHDGGHEKSSPPLEVDGHHDDDHHPHDQKHPNFEDLQKHHPEKHPSNDHQTSKGDDDHSAEKKNMSREDKKPSRAERLAQKGKDLMRNVKNRKKTSPARYHQILKKMMQDRHNAAVKREKKEKEEARGWKLWQKAELLRRKAKDETNQKQHPHDHEEKHKKQKHAAKTNDKHGEACEWPSGVDYDGDDAAPTAGEQLMKRVSTPARFNDRVGRSPTRMLDDADHEKSSSRLKIDADLRLTLNGKKVRTIAHKPEHDKHLEERKKTWDNVGKLFEVSKKLMIIWIGDTLVSRYLSTIWQSCKEAVLSFFLDVCMVVVDQIRTSFPAKMSTMQKLIDRYVVGQIA
ncbi:unnamed protein product, partial [Amoebophrya sp. A120]